MFEKDYKNNRQIDLESEEQDQNIKSTAQKLNNKLNVPEGGGGYNSGRNIRSPSPQSYYKNQDQGNKASLQPKSFEEGNKQFKKEKVDSKQTNLNQFVFDKDFERAKQQSIREAREQEDLKKAIEESEREQQQEKNRQQKELESMYLKNKNIKEMEKEIEEVDMEQRNTLFDKNDLSILNNKQDLLKRNLQPKGFQDLYKSEKKGNEKFEDKNHTPDQKKQDQTQEDEELLKVIEISKIEEEERQFKLKCQEKNERITNQHQNNGSSKYDMEEEIVEVELSNKKPSKYPTINIKSEQKPKNEDNGLTNYLNKLNFKNNQNGLKRKMTLDSDGDQINNKNEVKKENNIQMEEEKTRQKQNQQMVSENNNDENDKYQKLLKNSNYPELKLSGKDDKNIWNLEAKDGDMELEIEIDPPDIIEITNSPKNQDKGQKKLTQTKLFQKNNNNNNSNNSSNNKPNITVNINYGSNNNNNRQRGINNSNDNHFKLESYMLSERVFRQQRQQELERQIPEKFYLLQRTLKSILKDKHITISGYEGEEKNKIKQLIDELGGVYQPELDELCNYMILKDKKTDKYNSYLKNKDLLKNLKVVTKSFLTSCKGNKKEVDWIDHLVE